MSSNFLVTTSCTHMGVVIKLILFFFLFRTNTNGSFKCGKSEFLKNSYRKTIKIYRLDGKVNSYYGH